MHRVLGFVAVQQCQVTAELYGVQNFIGVNEVTNKAAFNVGCRAALVQAACTGPKHCCCAKVLGYSRAVWGATSHRCKCCHKQGCFQYGLLSSTGAGSMHRVLSIVAVQQCWVTAELYGVQHPIGVNAVTNKAVFNVGCRAALVQAACTGS